jgi:hypothetical protein
MTPNGQAPKTRTTEFNTIYILESRQEGDAKIGSELAQWLKYRVMQVHDATVTVEYSEVNSKKGLIKVLNQIRNNIDAEKYPFIHFEMHGNPEGLLVGKDLVPWSGVINLLRTINIPAKNQLLVSFAVCNAFFLYPEIDIFKRSPFFAFIGNVNKVKFGEIEEAYQDFFDIMLSTGNLNAAIEALNKGFLSDNHKFHCSAAVDFFNQVWDSYNDGFKDPDRKKKKVMEVMGMALSDINVRQNLSLPNLRYQMENILSDKGRSQMREEMLANFLDMR